jgi:hypothetical protein
VKKWADVRGGWQRNAGNPGGLVGVDFMGQFKTDIGLDWMGIHGRASNNHPSKPFLFIIIIYLLYI